ncbi:MAG: RNA polymerase sigma-70 factor [Chloroflexia bacterium]|nr:RNA polymerase sigma-70 factor [Chloroflexia bacterium]
MNNANSSIVKGIKLGSEKSLKVIFDQYHSPLVAFAKNIVHNPLLAEDFVQDAFCSLWENRSKLKNEQYLHSYLFKIVYRRCVDYLRKQSVQKNFGEYTKAKLKELDLIQNSIENYIISAITAKEAQEIIQNTLNSLSDQTREIFNLSRHKSLRNVEIAKKMGVSVKSVEYHISKVLQQLRESLKEFL